MSGRARAFAALLAGASSTWLAAACGDRNAPPVERGDLPPGIAARAGNEDVRVASVARIAQAQGISPAQARDRAIVDALFAASARANPAGAASVSAAERSVLARAVLERVRDDTRARGAPTDDEVQVLTAERWPELDRPPSVRATHAVVLAKNPGDDAPARALAATLAAAVHGAKDSADFLERAQKIKDPNGKLEVRAEELPPVTADGRIWDPDERPPKPLAGALDLAFTRAAHALEKVGDQSPVVKTPFGYHVLFLAERYPAVEVPLEERRTRLEADVLTRRGKHELDALVARLRGETAVVVERSADALTGLIPVAP